MVVASSSSDIVRTADGTPLKARLQRVERTRKLRAVGLVLPLFLFILISFVRPIVAMLQNGIDDPEYVGAELTQTMAALGTWSGQDVPDETVFVALVADLKQAQKDKTAPLIGKRLNYVLSGIRSKIIVTARKADKLEAGPYKEAVIAIDPVWGQTETWLALRQAGSRFTPLYLMIVLDRTWPYASNAERNPATSMDLSPAFIILLAGFAGAFAVCQVGGRGLRAAPYLFAGTLAVLFVISIQQPDTFARYGVAAAGILVGLSCFLGYAHPAWRPAAPYFLGGAIACLGWFVVLSTTVAVDPSQAVYMAIFVRTFWISLLVTLTTLVLGFPVAYLLASLPTKTSNLLMILVLLPFWTSLLVRTTAWFVLLLDNGVINDLLQFLHLTDHPLRLILSRFGTVVAMTHIQLPFTLLPIYSVMKTIPPSHVRAARSLGAGPFYAFWRVYFPQTVPGIAAGCLLTFILSLGYFITPALVGGPTDQMVSGFVYLAINQENNWGKASALGAILLVATMILFFVYNRLVGIDKMKFG